MFGKLLSVLTLVSLVAATPVDLGLDKRSSHKGQATYFEVGLGACGWVSTSLILHSSPNLTPRASGTRTRT